MPRTSACTCLPVETVWNSPLPVSASATPVLFVYCVEEWRRYEACWTNVKRAFHTGFPELHSCQAEGHGGTEE